MFFEDMTIETDDEQYSALHYAIRYGHVNSARILIEKFHCDVNRIGKDGETPLHTAARYDFHLDQLPAICSRENLLAKDFYGRTVLHHAAMRNHFQMAKQLIDLGASVHVFDLNKSTPLHLACRYHSLECVRLFLQHNALVDQQDINGNTPLHELARSQQPTFNESIAYELLNHTKSSLEIENNEHKTVLSLACEYNHEILVRLLCNYRTNVHDCMPFHMAIKSGNINIVELLLNNHLQLISMNINGETMVHLACRYNRIDILKMFLSYRINIEIRDQQGFTPLLTACSMNHYECIEILLRNQANFYATDNHERNILHLCIERNCPRSLVVCLRWIDGDVSFIEQVDRYGNTVLHTAAKTNSIEICEILFNSIQCSDLILKTNQNNRTAVHEAAKQGNFMLIKFFFQFSISQVQLCEHRDDQFQTCLHLACSQGHYQIVEYLLHQGANVSSLDMNDSTPLHKACTYNHYSCVELLLSFHAPIDPFDRKHSTPLHYASQFGHWQIVGLLLNSHANVQSTTSIGYNSFELAILNNHQRTVEEFLLHRTWKDSLRNAQIENNSISTPIRKLIKYMPTQAEFVFNRCTIEYGQRDECSYRIFFDYEFLEDQLSIFKWRNECPSKTIALLRQTHPLYLIISSYHYDLLKHPLIHQLIQRKWSQFSRTCFWILFLFYVFFLASFTSTILRVHHPQYYYSLFNASISTVSCQTISLNLIRHESFILTKKNSYDTLIKWLLFSTILIHIIKNFVLISIRFQIFFALSNILELIALILSIIFSHDFYSWQMSIRFRCSFQWQCGAVGILIGWITLLIYIQFLSTSGIYVVMLEVILRKFFRFIPILIVFVFGFGLSFHMLLQNQTVYHHTFDSLIRTILMLTGEFNYEEHLYENGINKEKIYYQLIYLLYVLFCILITILIINLLIANAVGEISRLIEHANIKYSIMYIKLTMDYEIFLSTFECLIPYLKIRVKNLIENNQNETIYPNQIDRFQRLKSFFFS